MRCVPGARSRTRWPQHASMFPTYYVGILRSAEITGNLDVVLEQLADYIERDLETTRAIKSALTVPGRDPGDVDRHRDPAGLVRAAEVQDVLQELRREAAAPDADAAERRRLLRRATGSIVLGVAVAILVFLVVFLQTEPGKRWRDKVAPARAAREGRHSVRRGRALLPDPERDARRPVCRCPKR